MTNRELTRVAVGGISGESPLGNRPLAGRLRRRLLLRSVVDHSQDFCLDHSDMLELLAAPSDAASTAESAREPRPTTARRFASCFTKAHLGLSRRRFHSVSLSDTIWPTISRERVVLKKRAARRGSRWSSSRDGSLSL